jgi:hypothetical protein
MSHAINMLHLVDATKMVGPQSTRPRPTNGVAIKSVANMTFRYIASVDEMKGFLTDKFGDGEEISRNAMGGAATAAQSKSYIQDRPGIVVFMGTSKSYAESGAGGTTFIKPDKRKDGSDSVGWCVLSMGPRRAQGV